MPGSLSLGGTVTSSSGAAPVPSAAPGQIALVVESSPDVNKLIDDVFNE